MTHIRLAVVVLYHVVGDPPGDPSRELAPALGTRQFTAQIGFLARQLRPVSTVNLLAAAANRRRGGRIPVAVTFDDDLTSHTRTVRPILAAAGVPATFFLCGGSLDQPHAFWWEHLQRAFDAGNAAETLAAAGATEEDLVDIHAVGRWFERLPAAERAARGRALHETSALSPGRNDLDARQVATLSQAGFAVGFHTLRHDPLTGLDDAGLRSALLDGREELEAFDSAIAAVAYPHGYYDARVIAATGEAGFTLGFTTEQEAILASDDPLALGRIDASTQSLDGLRWALAAALVRGAIGRRRQVSSRVPDDRQTTRRPTRRRC